MDNVSSRQFQQLHQRFRAAISAADFSTSQELLDRQKELLEACPTRADLEKSLELLSWARRLVLAHRGRIAAEQERLDSQSLYAQRYSESSRNWQFSG